MNKKTKKVKIKVGGMKLPDFGKKGKDYYHTKAENKMEALIFGLIPQISKALGLADMCYFVQTIKEVDPRQFETGSGTMVMSINCVKEYKTVYINLLPVAQTLFDRKEFSLVSRALVHEMAHIVTYDLSQMAQDRIVTEDALKKCIEETTESVAQIARKILEIESPNVYKFN